MQPVVSVVIPAYDVAPYLQRSLDSLLRQSLGFDRIEVIAVDDGSRDGSGEVLDRFASGRPNVHVVHQQNSGGPGGPRNLGVARSRGEHLFFLDPDDHLGEEALERLLAAAERNDADVVLGRIVGVGRNAPRRPFAADVERGDLLTTRAVWSLSCQKLFRRSHVLEQGLRFAEGTTLGEDQEFVLGAYLTARVISVVASYPCYYLELREDGGNATRTDADPAQLYGMVGRVLALVDRHAPEGPVRQEVLARCYSVEVSSRLGGPGFLRLSPDQRADYLRCVRPLVERYVDDRLLAGFPALDRVRGHLLRHGTVADLEQLARFEVHTPRPVPLEEAGRTYARYPLLRSGRGVPDACYDITTEPALDHCTVAVRWQGTDLRVDWEPYAPALRQPDVRWSLVLERPDGGPARIWPAQAGSVTVPLTRGDSADDRTSGLPDGVWAMVTRAGVGGRAVHAAVGAAGTAPEPVDARPRLLWGRLAVLGRDGRGRLHLHLGSRWDRLPAAVQDLREDDARSRVVVDLAVDLEGLARDVRAQPDRWRATLLLRHRRSGREVQAGAVLSVSSEGAPVVAAALPLADSSGKGLEPGLWDVHLRLDAEGLRASGRVRASGRLPQAFLHLGRPVVPYATAHGNLSLDVGATSPSRRPRAVLTSARWRRRAELGLGLAVQLQPFPGDGPVDLSLVLRERAGREAVLPLALGLAPATAPAAVRVALDLPALVADGRLSPGTWELGLRGRWDGTVWEMPVLSALGPAGSGSRPRRWARGRRLLSARLSGRSSGPVLVVAHLPLRRLLERCLHHARRAPSGNG